MRHRPPRSHPMHMPKNHLASKAAWRSRASSCFLSSAFLASADSASGRCLSPANAEHDALCKKPDPARPVLIPHGPGHTVLGRQEQHGPGKQRRHSTLRAHALSAPKEILAGNDTDSSLPFLPVRAPACTSPGSAWFSWASQSGTGMKDPAAAGPPFLDFFAALSVFSALLRFAAAPPSRASGCAGAWWWPGLARDAGSQARCSARSLNTISPSPTSSSEIEQSDEEPSSPEPEPVSSHTGGTDVFAESPCAGCWRGVRACAAAL